MSAFIYGGYLSSPSASLSARVSPFSQISLKGNGRRVRGYEGKFFGNFFKGTDSGFESSFFSVEKKTVLLPSIWREWKFECNAGSGEDVGGEENDVASPNPVEEKLQPDGMSISVNKLTASDAECGENENCISIDVSNDNCKEEKAENDDALSDIASDASQNADDKTEEYDMSVLKERIRAMEENEILKDRLAAKNWKEGKCEHRVVAVLNDWVRKLKFHGDVLAVGTYKGVLYTYDLVSGKQFSKFKGHRTEITCLDFDGARLVAGSDATTFLLWDTTGLDSPTISFQGHTQSITAVKLVGQRVLSCSRDSSLRIWQASTGECIHVAQSGSPIFCLDFDEDVALLGLSNGMVASYSLSSLKLEKTFQAHQHSVCCIQYDAKLDYVITGSSRGSIRLWKYSTGEFIRSFQGHQGEITSIQFDSVKVVSSARDGTVNVWDLSNGKCLFSILGHTAYIGSAQFDQSKLISDGFNNVVVCHDFVF